MKISVVIPVYQAGKYIGAAIDDLKSQTMGDFEVFLVDNGSTDDSEIVMKEAVGSDERFLFLSEGKRGVSAARNRGLSAAVGEWILFLDADDRFPRDMLERLLEGTQAPAVMAVSGYQTYADGKIVYESPEVSREYTPRSMTERLFQVEHYQGFIWNKLFQTERIKKQRICFHEDIFYNEDRLFVLEYLLGCYKDSGFSENVVRMIPAKTYCYCLHEVSAMAVSRDAASVTEKEVTEIEAFSRMLEKIRSILGEDSETYRLAVQDRVRSELRMFRRMIGRKEVFRYRKHALRSFARRGNKTDVRFLDEREQILWNIFVRYGKTGMTYTRDPEFFG